jgi:hypothetical protein
MINKITVNYLPEEGHSFFESIDSLCLEIVLCPITLHNLMQNFLNAVLQLEPNHALLAARILAHLPESYVVELFPTICNQFHDSNIHAEV